MKPAACEAGPVCSQHRPGPLFNCPQLPVLIPPNPLLASQGLPSPWPWFLGESPGLSALSGDICPCGEVTLGFLNEKGYK